MISENTQQLANEAIALAAWNTGRDLMDAPHVLMGEAPGDSGGELDAALLDAIIEGLHGISDYECGGSMSQGDYCEYGVADFGNWEPIYWWFNNAEHRWHTEKPEWWDEQMAALTA